MKPALQIFNFSLLNQADGVYDINIDGDIVDAPTQEIYKNFWGDETSVSFRSFRNEIQKANPKTLNIYVNSTGGHVGDAMAMHDFLVELENKGVTVNRTGRGIIASAATYLVVGKNSSMTSNSMMMIHNVQMVVAGDIVQCENQVKMGRKFNNLIRDFYSNATGKPAETVSSWMNKETWFTAQEAKDNGFVQSVANQATFSNSIKEDLWPYNDKAILNSYNSFTIKNEEMDINKVIGAIETGFSNLMKKLGLENKLADDAGKAALTEFSGAIVNALKGELLTEEKVSELINKATEGDAEELAKTFVNKTDLEDLKKDIIKNLGNKSEGNEIVPKEKVVNSKNRFAGKTFFNAETK